MSLMSYQHSQLQPEAQPLDSSLPLDRIEQNCFQKQSSSSSTFNGIIFRERSLLEELGVYQTMQKQVASILPITKRLLQTCLSISIKLSFQATLKWNAKITLTEYHESFFANIKFAYIKRNYSFSGHQFTKINLVAEDISKDIKVLLSNKAYSQLVRILNSKGIKYYVMPSPNFFAHYCSRNFTLSQLCLQGSALTFQPFDDRIQYANSCTFNGKQNCFVVFTATKSLVFHNRSLLKQISKEAFLQKEYWIESKEDWISFERKDHFLVFQRKFEEVTYRNTGIIQYPLSFVSSQPSQSIQQTIKKQAQIYKQASHYWQSDIKGLPTNKQAFMSEQIQHHREADLQKIEQPTIRRKLFCGEGQSMLDQNESLKEKKIEVEQIMVDEQIFNNEAIQEEKDHSNINQRFDSEMMEESYQQNEIEASKEKDQSKLDEDLDACQLNSNTFHSTLSQNVDNATQKEYTSSKKADKEDIQKIAILDEKREIDSLNLKENSKLLANNGFKSEGKLLKRDLSSEISIEEQYVYQPKQCFINLSNRIQDYSTNNSLLASNPLIFDEVSRKEKMQRVWPIEVCQISPSILTVLSAEKIAHVFQRSNSPTYQQQDYYIPNVSKIFKGNSQSYFFYCDEKDQDIYEFNLKTTESKEINTDFLNGKEIKDAKSVYDNQLTFLTDSSIQILDRRISKGLTAISFKTDQLFEKLDIHQNIAAVGRSDGIVKLYDLRSLKSRSLNNFDLNSELNCQYPQSFRQLRILENLNIFCQYNNSAIIISAEDKGSKSIYTSKLKNAERSFLQQFSVSPLILRSIDKLDLLPDEISFSTNSLGTSMRSFYKGYEFHFDMKSEKVKQWGKGSAEEGHRCIHAGLNSHCEDGSTIYAYYSKQGFSFKETQKQ